MDSTVVALLVALFAAIVAVVAHHRQTQRELYRRIDDTLKDD